MDRKRSGLEIRDTAGWKPALREHSGKHFSEKLQVAPIAIEDGSALRHRPFNLNPTREPDVLHRFMHFAKVDVSLPQKRSVFFGVKFANQLSFSELANLFVDIVTPIVGVADIVVNLNRL